MLVYVCRGFPGPPGSTEGQVVPVDMQIGIMRELGAQWLVAFFDHVRSHPHLIVNGFKETGIVDMIEKGEVTLPIQDRSLPNPTSANEADPFQDIDSD